KKLNAQLENLNTHLEDKVKEQTRELLGAYEIEKKARIELQRISEEKDRFIMITQHELRTPLTAIKWGMETMLSGGFGDITQAQMDYGNSAKESADRLIKVVNKMSNSNEKKLYSATGSVEQSFFAPVLERVLSAFELYREEKKIEIRKDIRIGREVALKISSEKLYQIISNLLDNSLKYTPVEGKITLSLYGEDEKTVTMKISDNGIGIPSESKDMLFSKFYRATNAMAMHPNGSGLGLCIIKSLVEQTGGKISVVSEGEGKGTTVTIVFQRV
ncbi:HAMP domain-containing histidine kinase, partial [Patescibacteria group bacterium]